MTIKERAEKYIKDDKPYATDYQDTAESDAIHYYIVGATEQKTIDIEKFLSLLDKAIDEWNEPHRHEVYQISKEGALKRFRDLLEE